MILKSAYQLTLSSFDCWYRIQHKIMDYIPFLKNKVNLNVSKDLGNRQLLIEIFKKQRAWLCNHFYKYKIKEIGAAWFKMWFTILLCPNRWAWIHKCLRVKDSYYYNTRVFIPTSLNQVWRELLFYKKDKALPKNIKATLKSLRRSLWKI